MDNQNQQGANSQNPNRQARTGQTRGNVPARGSAQTRSTGQTRSTQQGARTTQTRSAQQGARTTQTRSAQQGARQAQTRTAAPRSNGQGARPAQQQSRAAQALRTQQAARVQQARAAQQAAQQQAAPQVPSQSASVPVQQAAAPQRGEVKVMGPGQFNTYDTSAIRPKKKSKAPVIIVTIVILALLAVGGYFGWKFLSDKFGGEKIELLPAGQTAEVTIPEGALASDIGAILQEARLVESSEEFYKRVLALEADTALKPGTYIIEGGTDMNDIISMLKEGPGMTGIPLTIPEGFTRKSAAKAVETATEGRITAKQFMNATAKASAYAADYPFLKEVKDKSLEGFLFPKTYGIQEDATVDDIVRMMLDQYVKELEELDFTYPEEQGLSPYEALILASIVEGEATTSTKPKVAAIFYNRLSTEGAPTYGYLQSDATTAFEVGHEPTPEEVHADTPYSTYAHQGLCPTPVCSPSIDSLEAVCHPDMEFIKDGYFYFYFADDAEGYIQCYFSKTLEEHEAAIAAH